jgi:hypothetical protein
MKKMTSNILMLSIILIAGQSTANAQNNGRDLAGTPKDLGFDFKNPSVNGSGIRLNEININAARDFKRKFKNATNITWTKSTNLTSVYFNQDDIRMRSTYNAKGDWEYTIRYYDEYKLPSEIRHLVRSTYYDMPIIMVTEFKRVDQITYFIRLENQKTLLTVMIREGEMTIFEQLSKKP